MFAARRLAGTIARNRLVSPKPEKKYVKWYMELADRAHKAVVLLCVGVTGWFGIANAFADRQVFYGVGVVYMFIQSRKNKGELRRRLIEVCRPARRVLKRAGWSH